MSRITIIKSLLAEARTSQYNELASRKFKFNATKFLKAVVAKLDHPATVKDIRFNRGGIAGSGDAILHTDHIYILINDFSCYYRTVKGKKDYTGDFNRTPKSDWTAEEFAENINSILSPKFQTV